MQIKNWKVLFMLPLLAASCSHDPATEQPVAKRLTVTVGADPKIDIESQSGGASQAGVKSRTALGGDGVSVTWTAGDTVALWAMKSDGGAQFAAKPFAMWHYNAEFDEAKFTADIDPMPDDTYTYYAVSPRPKSLNGMYASYVIPTEQTGVFDASCGVMVAAPMQGGALREGDNSDIINFHFSHKIHILKIRIPENKMGMPVSALELTFPEPVTGTLTVDATNPDAAPVLTDGSNTLTLRFAQPIDAGATLFAVIAPVDLSASLEPISIKAYTASKESVPTTMRGKNFQQAHTTPIALTIPEIYRITHIGFSLDGDGTQTLGEKIQNFTLTAPAGVDLGNGSNTHTFAVNEENQYTISYEGAFNDNLSNQSFSVAFDSENAVVSSAFTMPQLRAEERNTVAGFKVPYLLFEDFSGSGTFSGSGLTGNPGGTELSSAGLPGWYAGARCQGYAGTCVNLQLYSNLGGPFHSRISTCKLSGIKAGKTIPIKVVFNSDWKKNKSGAMRLIVGRSTGTKLNDGIDNSSNITMDNNSSASSSNIPTLRNVTIANLTSDQSISWKTDGSNGGFVFAYEDVFIDNIRVSIAR